MRAAWPAYIILIYYFAPIYDPRISGSPLPKRQFSPTHHLHTTYVSPTLHASSYCIITQAA